MLALWLWHRDERHPLICSWPAGWCAAETFNKHSTPFLFTYETNSLKYTFAFKCMLGIFSICNVSSKTLWIYLNIENFTSCLKLFIPFLHLEKNNPISHTSFFTHPNRNIIMSVIFSYDGHQWPRLIRIIGVKCDEFICAILVQSINLDGVLQSIGQEKHLHLGRKKT